MKTFFGFTTGLFTGIGVGLVGMAALLLVDKDFREFVDERAEDLGY